MEHKHESEQQVQVHRVMLEFGSGEVYISWITSSSPGAWSQPLDSPSTMLVQVLLQPFIDPAQIATVKISLWCWGGIFKIQLCMVPMQSCADLWAGTGAEAAALLPTSNHHLRDRVLFQQKVCPIAKYQLQRNLSKLELHDISHNSRENSWNLSSQAVVMWLASSHSTAPDLHSCRLASLNLHPQVEVLQTCLRRIGMHADITHTHTHIHVCALQSEKDYTKPLWGLWSSLRKLAKCFKIRLSHFSLHILTGCKFLDS